VNSVPCERVPLLAICVPTFNRVSSLNNLLNSLGSVKTRFGEEVEICISNNGSTDYTAAAINAFANEYRVIVKHHSSNLGATLNIISVVTLMSARWGIWCGDDDELDPNAIERVLCLLRTLTPETWVLVDSAAIDGRGQYMSNFVQGDHDSGNFRYAVLRSGLDPFGFMGVHVFPRSAIPILQMMSVDDIRPWPPIVCMLSFIMQPGKRVYVLPEMPILQAKGGAKLFWHAGDLARVHLSKLRILRYLYLMVNEHYIFLHFLMLKELYALPKLSLMIAWKLYEPDNFDANAITAYREAWANLDALRLLTLPHSIVTLVLCALPHKAINLFFRITGYGYLLERYKKRKDELKAFDGIKRKL
jgi:glycosyltransferase involved in cell wall biosynthesis